jgi:hypothetical protein
MILIVSSNDDEHARAVMNHLKNRERSKVILLNLSDFPQMLQLSMNYNHEHGNDINLYYNGDAVSLSSCRVIWWRRPRPFEIHPEITNPAYRNFTLSECIEAFSGLWLSLPNIKWVNHPTKNDVASSKPYQLRMAQKLGMKIPNTLITNNPIEAKAFIERNDKDGKTTVYKAFSATEHEWRETRIIKPDEVNLIDNVRFAPVIFQEYISAAVDLRVTVIGDRVFAAAIYSQETSYKVDYRMSMSSARIESFNLPSSVRQDLRELTNNLDISYGAIDMRLTHEGEFVFIEVNPAGQWLFIEERTGQPITRTFAEFLSTHDG